MTGIFSGLFFAFNPSTTIAYADGRAEAQTPSQLGTSPLKLTKYFDDNFAEKDL